MYPVLPPTKRNSPAPQQPPTIDPVRRSVGEIESGGTNKKQGEDTAGNQKEREREGTRKQQRASGTASETEEKRPRRRRRSRGSRGRAGREGKEQEEEGKKQVGGAGKGRNKRERAGRGGGRPGLPIEHSTLLKAVVAPDQGIEHDGQKVPEAPGDRGQHMHRRVQPPASRGARCQHV